MCRFCGRVTSRNATAQGSVIRGEHYVNARLDSFTRAALDRCNCAPDPMVENPLYHVVIFTFESIPEFSKFIYTYYGQSACVCQVRLGLTINTR